MEGGVGGVASFCCCCVAAVAAVVMGGGGRGAWPLCKTKDIYYHQQNMKKQVSVYAYIYIYTRMYI